MPLAITAYLVSNYRINEQLIRIEFGGKKRDLMWGPDVG